jgi:hypothetical protein
MRTYTVIILLLIIAPETGYCLTENSKVSILTSEPGRDLYTIFGHSAIRITDVSLNIDRVYNFGTFDFSSSFFYLKFLKGNLDYFLSIDDYGNFLSNSKLEKRKVYEQILNLNFNERLRLFNRLESQYKSDDRYYKYDFFYDNCATRVRDAIFNAKTDPIVYDTNSYCCQTFRQLLKPYIFKYYWIDFVVNISLGNKADKAARPNEFMFLPFYIKNMLQDVRIVDESGIVADAPVSNKTRFNYSHVTVWLGALLIILLSFITKYRKAIFYVFVSLVGLIGLILITVSLVFDIPAFSSNFNIIWTIPSLLVVLIRNKQINDVIKLLYISLLISMSIFWIMLPQGFSITFIPWIMTLVIILLMDLQWVKNTTRVITATLFSP